MSAFSPRAASMRMAAAPVGLELGKTYWVSMPSSRWKVRVCCRRVSEPSFADEADVCAGAGGGYSLVGALAGGPTWPMRILGPTHMLSIFAGTASLQGSEDKYLSTKIPLGPHAFTL
jgi:hypothetical protein